MFASVWRDEAKEVIINLAHELKSKIEMMQHNNDLDTGIINEVVQLVNSSMHSVAKNHAFLYIISYSIKDIRLQLIDDIDSSEIKIEKALQDLLIVINDILKVEESALQKKDVVSNVKIYQNECKEFLSIGSSRDKVKFPLVSTTFICSLFPVISSLQGPPFNFESDSQYLTELYHNSAVSFLFFIV